METSIHSSSGSMPRIRYTSGDAAAAHPVHPLNGWHEEIAPSGHPSKLMQGSALRLPACARSAIN
jgi:hypothetical protein